MLIFVTVIYKLLKTIMRNLSILFALVFAVASCQQSKSYQINGTVAETAYEGTTVYLQQSKGREMISLDSAVITDGVFKMSGDADTAKVLFLSLDRSAKPGSLSRTMLVVEPGKINVNFGEEITLSGTKLNNAFDVYNKSQNLLGEKMGEISKKFQEANQDGTITPELEEELRNEYEGIYKEANIQTVDLIKSNMNNELGKFMFLSNASGFELETQKEILALADDAFKADENIQKIITRIEQSEKVAVGQKFLDFSMQNPAGDQVSLSDYAGKGKVVLIDFWAAWCGPCRQEMPNVVEAYKDFKDKGFEVVGVSLDRTEDEWLKGVADLNMTWPQMSDLKFWETPVVELYAFRGIPHTVLLDADGIIIEKNLRGKALHDKLSELLN